MKHEGNRRSLFEASLPHYLVTSLSVCSATSHTSRILATLRAIKSFTLDDDMRTEFGKAHENARHMVEEEGLLLTCLQLIRG